MSLCFLLFYFCPSLILQLEHKVLEGHELVLTALGGTTGLMPPPGIVLEMMNCKSHPTELDPGNHRALKQMDSVAGSGFCFSFFCKAILCSLFTLHCNSTIFQHLSPPTPPARPETLSQWTKSLQSQSKGLALLFQSTNVSLHKAPNHLSLPFWHFMSRSFATQIINQRKTIFKVLIF